MGSGATPVRVAVEPRDVRPQRRRDRGRDHRANPGDHRELAAQPDAADLHARRTAPAGRGADRGLGAQQPPDLPGLRRGLLAHRLRRSRVPSPTEFYPNSFLVYTYGKQLLTPGQRLGYVALPPEMPEREEMRTALMLAQLAMAGHGVPNAVLQYALADLDAHDDRRQGVAAQARPPGRGLRAAGYELHPPEGTFYLLPTSPDRRRRRVHRAPRRAEGVRAARDRRRDSRAASASRSPRTTRWSNARSRSSRPPPAADPPCPWSSASATGRSCPATRARPRVWRCASWSRWPRSWAPAG